jgi:hypothetical protein
MPVAQPAIREMRTASNRPSSARAGKVESSVAAVAGGMAAL